MSNLLGSFSGKLSDKDVYEILYKNKVEKLLPYQIEEYFDVSRGTIKNIVNGRSRKDCYYLFHKYMKESPEKFVELFGKKE